MHVELDGTMMFMFMEELELTFVVKNLLLLKVSKENQVAQE
jgi:hypothetical protein